MGEGLLRRVGQAFDLERFPLIYGQEVGESLWDLAHRVEGVAVVAVDVEDVGCAVCVGAALAKDHRRYRGRVTREKLQTAVYAGDVVAEIVLASSEVDRDEATGERRGVGLNPVVEPFGGDVDVCAVVGDPSVDGLARSHVGGGDHGASQPLRGLRLEKYRESPAGRTRGLA